MTSVSEALTRAVQAKDLIHDLTSKKGLDRHKVGLEDARSTPT